MDTSSKISFAASAPRKHFVKHRIQYYGNHTASFDVEKPFLVNVHPNPGPSTVVTNTKTGRVSKRTPNVSFLSLNARSIVNKTAELCARLLTNTYHLVAVTETWMDSHITDSEIFPCNFQVQRRDRSRHGGGVLLACCQEFGLIRREDLETECEILWCEVVIPNPTCKILIGVFYRPPSTGEIYMQELGRSLALIERSGNNMSTLLLGDFNLPHINWSTPSPTYSDNLSAVLCEITDDHFLKQMVIEPTRNDNILDLVFTSAPELVNNVAICEGLGNSDHHAVEFKLKLKYIRAKRGPRIVYNFRSADWSGLKEDLKNIPWNCINMFKNIDDIWDAWKTLFFQSVERNVPTKLIKPQRNTPWFNSDLKKLIHKKRRLWKQAKSSGNPEKWSQYKSFSNKVKDSLNKSYWNYVKNLTSSLSDNPKKFWSFVKSRTGISCVPSCIEHGEQRAYSAERKANMFNKVFHSVFNDNLARTSESDIDMAPVCVHSISDLICAEAEVAKLLNSLQVNKACGPDKISPKILKECSAELAPSLVQLYNHSLSLGKLPSDWKMANVVPLHKSGDRVQVSNYRPVSLTSVIVKTLERVIHKHIMNFFSGHQLLSDSQHGFRERRSCVTQLLQLLHHWFSTLDKRQSVDAIFLDFAKAFDKVSHPHLLHKLKCYGINNHLLFWIKDFLTERKQRVVIDGQASGWLDVTSGVPQGSILGPLLFLVYINDLPSTVNCNSELFADDSVLHRTITKVDDCHQLQNDISRTSSWCRSWMVTLKSEKCKVLHISKLKNRINHQYTLNNRDLPAVKQHKHLGIWLDSSLSWDYHINSICGKANRILGLIRRTFGPGNPVGVRTAFNALVRPTLEYGCPVWNPHLVKHVNAIESIQRRATRLICGSTKSYPERLSELNWATMELRRKFLSMVQLYKIIFGLNDIDCTKFLDLVGPTMTRRNHDFKLRPLAFRTNYFKFSFFNRYLQEWNSLPAYVVNAPSLSSFKLQLRKYLAM